MPVPEPEPESEPEPEPAEEAEYAPAPAPQTRGGWRAKYIAGAAALALAALMALLWLLRGRRSRALLLAALLLAVLGAAACLLDIKTPAEYRAAQNSGTEAVYVSIDGSAGGGVQTGRREVYISAGQTALDALRELCRTEDIALSIRGGYVAGVGGLYEFDGGPTSGWLYHVNGETPSVGSGEYELHAGDIVEWEYITELRGEEDGGDK